MSSNPNPKGSKKQILDEHREIENLAAKVCTQTGSPAESLHCLERLLPLLERHFRAEEDEISGLHANIRRRSPEQQNALLGLKDEHAQLLARGRSLLAMAKDVVAKSTELRDATKQLQADLATHEAKETELFVDSIWTDIGVGD
ncbi:MAG: hemerythrin domain-containing protein [Planctomycetota bacterium]